MSRPVVSHSTRFALAFALVLAIAGCDKDVAGVPGIGSPCDTSEDCGPDLRCNSAGVCVPRDRCETVADCVGGYLCVGGQCIPPGGGDDDDLDVDEAPPVRAQLVSEPDQINFGAVGVGTSTNRGFVLRNIGTDTITVSSVVPSASLPADEFVLTFEGASPSFPMVIPAGDGRPFTFTYTALVEQPHEGSLTVTSNDPERSTFEIGVVSSIKGHGKLDCEPPTKRIPLTAPNVTRGDLFVCHNNGTAPVVITSSEIVESTGGNWEVEAVAPLGSPVPFIPLPITVGAGDSQRFAVRFRHDTVGNWSARGLMHVDDPQAQEGSIRFEAEVADIPVNGRITCPAEVELGYVDTRQELRKRFACRNVGDSQLLINAATIINQTGGAWQISVPAANGVLPFSVDIGQPVEFEVRFLSAADGRFRADANIESSDPMAPTIPVRLIANVRYLPAGPCYMSCSPRNIDFGSVPPNQSRRLVIGCRNEGGENMTITSVTFAPSDPEFTLHATALPAVVAPLHTFAIQVTYTPTDPGVDTATIKITNDGTCGDGIVAVEIPVRGQLGFEPVWPVCTPPRTFQPAVVWERRTFTEFPRWTQSWSSPVVAQLTDDNGDGRIDEEDMPDVAITTCECINCGGPTQTMNDPRPAVIRVLSGDTGAEKRTIGGNVRDARGNEYDVFIDSEVQIAVADIDLDGRPEFVGVEWHVYPGDCDSASAALFASFGGECPEEWKLGHKFKVGKLVAFEDDGTLKWISEPWSHSQDEMENMTPVTIADLDADGVPEILAGVTVWDNNGRILWDAGPTGYPLTGHGPTVIAVDLDLDGKLEVVSGGSAWRHDGTPIFRVTTTDIILGERALAGIPAAADLDGDGYLEIVLGTGGTIEVLKHDGTWLVRNYKLVYESCDQGEGGGGTQAQQGDGFIPTAPVLADFDGDGLPEIGTAAETRLFMLKLVNGRLVEQWTADMNDCTGAANPVAFDFEGDGKYELVFGDENKLVIYRGTTGQRIYSADRFSVTGAEVCALADVDKDGHADIVIPLNTGFAGFSGGGVRVVGAANNDWVGTATIWNEFNYHWTNVVGNGLIPYPEEHYWRGRWRTYNAFRTQMPFCAE